MNVTLDELLDYRFSQGTLRELIDLAGEERRETCRVTCKCCGRMMLPSQQSFEMLYSCSTKCYAEIKNALVQDVEYLEQAYSLSTHRWD